MEDEEDSNDEAPLSGVTPGGNSGPSQAPLIAGMSLSGLFLLLFAAFVLWLFFGKRT